MNFQKCQNVLNATNEIYKFVFNLHPAHPGLPVGFIVMFYKSGCKTNIIPFMFCLAKTHSEVLISRNKEYVCFKSLPGFNIQAKSSYSEKFCRLS